MKSFKSIVREQQLKGQECDGGDDDGNDDDDRMGSTSNDYVHLIEKVAGVEFIRMDFFYCERFPQSIVEIPPIVVNCSWSVVRLQLRNGRLPVRLFSSFHRHNIPHGHS